MIRSTPSVTELRFFKDQNAGPMAAYQASCLVIWDSDSMVTIRLLSGTISRPLWRDLLIWLSTAGVRTIRAARAEGHHIPLASEDEDGFLRCDVATLLARFRANPPMED